MNETETMGAGTRVENELPSDRVKRFLVRDVMSAPVYTARENWSLLDAARTMRTVHISGLPVVDAKDAVVGILSERDLTHDLDRAFGLESPRGMLDLLLAAGGKGGEKLIERYMDRMRRAKVSEAMSKKPVTIEEDATLGEAVSLIRQYGVNRLPVVKDGRLVGVLTRLDVLEILAPEVEPHHKKAPPVRHHTRGPQHLSSNA